MIVLFLGFLYIYIYIYIFFFTLCCPNGIFFKSIVHAGTFRVSVIHRTLPLLFHLDVDASLFDEGNRCPKVPQATNSDMDYMIFNVRT